MKKLLLLSILALSAMTMSAQTYEVYARSNDTIKLYAGALGAAAKSLIPGAAPAEPSYRMIKKIDKGVESMLFLDFVNIADKCIVSYETDMVTPGEWTTQVHSYVDLYNATKRINAIYLEGEYLGMKIQIYQRPLPYTDIFMIDGIQLQLPLKMVEIEALANKIQQIKEARIKELASMNLTEQDVKNAENYRCEYFLAYLYLTQRFNTSYSAEVREKFDMNVIKELMSSLNEEQLRYLVKTVNASKECGVYEAF